VPTLDILGICGSPLAVPLWCNGGNKAALKMASLLLVQRGVPSKAMNQSFIRVLSKTAHMPRLITDQGIS
jgi:hypothetical protein